MQLSECLTYVGGRLKIFVGQLLQRCADIFIRTQRFGVFNQCRFCRRVVDAFKKFLHLNWIHHHFLQQSSLFIHETLSQSTRRAQLRVIRSWAEGSSKESFAEKVNGDYPLPCLPPVSGLDRYMASASIAMPLSMPAAVEKLLVLLCISIFFSCSVPGCMIFGLVTASKACACR